MWEAHTCSDHWDKVTPATATANNAHWIRLPDDILCGIIILIIIMKEKYKLIRIFLEGFNFLTFP